MPRLVEEIRDLTEWEESFILESIQREWELMDYNNFGSEADAKEYEMRLKAFFKKMSGVEIDA